jgi:hypothetical protein
MNSDPSCQLVDQWTRFNVVNRYPNQILVVRCRSLGHPVSPSPDGDPSDGAQSRHRRRYTILRPNAPTLTLSCATRGLDHGECWNLLSAARGSNGGSSDVSRVLAQDGKSSVNLASHGHCAGIFIGV